MRIILFLASLLLAGCYTPAQPSTVPTLDPPRLTYVLTGLGGSAPVIGYGMMNLCPKIDCTLRSYLHRGRIVSEVKRLWEPGVKVVLVGHSLGGNAVTDIAAQVAPIPIHYMAVIDAPKPKEISENVRSVDNFLSTTSTVGKVLSKGSTLRLKGVGHIALGNHPKVHSRIIRRSQ